MSGENWAHIERKKERESLRASERVRERERERARARERERENEPTRRFQVSLLAAEFECAYVLGCTWLCICLCTCACVSEGTWYVCGLEREPLCNFLHYRLFFLVDTKTEENFILTNSSSTVQAQKFGTVLATSRKTHKALPRLMYLRIEKANVNIGP